MKIPLPEFLVRRAAERRKWLKTDSKIQTTSMYITLEELEAGEFVRDGMRYQRTPSGDFWYPIGTEESDGQA